MRQMNNNRNKHNIYRPSSNSNRKRRKGKLHLLERVAIALAVAMALLLVIFVIFIAFEIFNRANQPPSNVAAYTQHNDNNSLENSSGGIDEYDLENENSIEYFVSNDGNEIIDEDENGDEEETYLGEEYESEVCEYTESVFVPIFTHNEQMPQEVQYEQNNTEDETIVSEIQDTVTDLNEQELDTNITIRFISEIGLTYYIYIPALAPDDEVRYIMLHHTYGLFETDGSLRGMHNDHRSRTATLDGGGIAYSEIIQKDGTVWIARGELRPSHTGVSHDIRTHSYSITVTGNFHAEGAIMSDVQFNSLASRVAAAMRQFPNATIVGHGDLAPTSCPGRNFPWDRLEESIGAVRGVSRGESAQ